MAKKCAQIGTVSKGILLFEDLIPIFLEKIREIRGSVPFATWRLCCEWRSSEGVQRSQLSDMLFHNLYYLLDQLSPSYCYFYLS